MSGPDRDDYEIGAWRSRATGKWHNGIPGHIKHADQIRITYQNPGKHDGWFLIRDIPGGHIRNHANRIALIMDLVSSPVDYYQSRNG